MKRLILASLFVLALLPQTVWADDQQDAKRGSSGNKVILEWDEFKKITGWGTTPSASTDKITLPWSEVLEMLGVELKGNGETKVSISWQEFKELVKWSLEKKIEKPEPPAPPVKPPTPFVVTSAKYKGTASKDGIRLSLEMTINVLQKEGWKHIPILPGTVAIEKITLPADCYLDSKNGRYTVLTQKSGAITLVVDFATSVTESQGVFRGSFQRVPSSASTLSLTLEEEDAELSILGAQSVTKKEGIHFAALPSAGAVTISWRRAIQEVAVQAKLYSESQTLVSVAEGVIICRQSVRFSILHNKVDSFSLAVPKGVNVLSVVGPNLRDWRIRENTLLIDLDFPHLGDWNALITTEKSFGDGKAVQVPVLKTLGVEREKGYAVVVAVSNVEISTASMKGASAIDVRELPSSLIGMTNQPILLAYRYVSGDFGIQLAIDKHEDVAVLRTAVDSVSAMVVQTDDGILLTNYLMNVRNTRNQFLKIKMPEGFEVWSALVAGKSVKPAMAPDGTMLIPLVRSGSGGGQSAYPVEITYVLKGKKPLDKENDGILKIAFPRLEAPITHFMCTLYMPKGFSLPKKAKYYDGPLRFVSQFTSLSVGIGSAEQEAAMVRQAQQQQAQRIANSRGVQTIQVKLPVHGKPVQFEKILVIDEELWTQFEYEYDD